MRIRVNGYKSVATLAVWNRRVGIFAIVLAAVGAVGCATVKTEEGPAAEPVERTVLKVENRAFLDMTIYAYRSSQRVRLGQASGNSTTRLTIPQNLIFGSTSLRFQADPIGGNRQSVSQEITVSAGDEVVLIIPP